MFFLALFVITGVFAPLIAPHDPERGGLRDRNLPPAWEEGGTSEFLLGTDHLGRDMLSRVIFGARISLAVAGVTLGVGMVIGVASGLIAGWYGGWLDEFLMRIVDIKLAIPTILLGPGAGPGSGTVIPDHRRDPGHRRVARVLPATCGARLLQLKTMDFVALAKVAGASTPRILFIHIFPGVINTLIVLATLEVGIVILLESTLSFPGSGEFRHPRRPGAPWYPTDATVSRWPGGFQPCPGLAIMVTVLSMNLFGDWLRDRLDPRLRQLN